MKSNKLQQEGRQLAAEAEEVVESQRAKLKQTKAAAVKETPSTL